MRTRIMKSNAELLRPMPFWQSLFFFGISALVAAVSHYVFWPFFMGVGVSEETAYHCQALVVFTFLLIAALVAYAIEGNPPNWQYFRRRFRLFNLDRRGWKWTLGGLAMDVLLSLVATVLAIQVYNILKYEPPEVSPSGPIMKIPLMAFVLFMNIIGEELWWRGYILPRQEKQHGRYAWAIHGVLWAFFHAFKWWAVPFMLITTWIIPFIT